VPIERKISLTAFYNLLSASRGYGMAPHHYPIVTALEDTRIENFLFLGAPGTGKSNLLSSIYPAWELGHDPSLTVLAVSAGEALPQGFMSATMQIIQNENVFKELFPDVRPDKDMGWALGRGLFVTGHHPSDPDASYKAVGLTSKALTGLHARLHIYDDIHDEENASTPESRAAVVKRYYSTLMGRADPRGCRRIAAGRWWAADDVYQEWIGNGDWVVMQLPASRPGNTRLWYDVFVPKGLTCIFTETLKPEPDQDQDSPYVRYKAHYAAFDRQKDGFYWPDSPSKRKEYETVKRRQPRTAAINYDGNVEGIGSSVFDESDFRPYIPPDGLDVGIQHPEVQAWIKSMHGNVEAAWDTALGQPQSESLTAALTGLLVPCNSWHKGEDPEIVGPCDFHYDVWLLDLLLKNLNFRELVMALRQQYGLWHPRRVTIEEKQSGVGLLQTFKGTNIPVVGQMVHQGKMERAVNAIMADAKGLPIPGGAASVQGWAKMGRVLYPAGARWISHGPDGTVGTGFLKRVCAFAGGTRATDEFDALVHLVTRAITLSRKSAKMSGINQDLDIPVGDSRRDMLNAFSSLPGLTQLSENPMSGLCMAPCKYYTIRDNAERCDFHGRKTTGISGCTNWTERK
jgi:hypothetical protein